jgi:plasmid stabilization system protein ParE
MSVQLSLEAQEQLRAMTRHYKNLERREALRYLIEALEEAKAKIINRPNDGLRAPRPYPDLEKPGRLWIYIHRYWFSYQLATPPAFPSILGIFYDTNDIPGLIND